MNYEQDITRLLYEAGKDGLSVKKITRHIYNMHNGLFETVSYEAVYKDVVACISKNSKSKDGIFEKTGEWGHYRLNHKSNTDSQLFFNFEEQDTDGERDDISKPQADMSLSLF